MNLKLLILGITGLFAGCVTLTSNDSLYKSYNKFKADTNAETVINKAPLYFSERLLGEHYKDDPDAPDQLLFYKVMSQEKSVYESLNDALGCLVVNGFDDRHNPITFELTYAQSDHDFKIDKIHTYYHESANEFLLKAECAQ
ncbi:MAG: hypothetical protein VX185_16125 [Pseudomonadota bacterium]|nr:hypothetical protein [Pseudomonadota bacterium]